MVFRTTRALCAHCLLGMNEMTVEDVFDGIMGDPVWLLQRRDNGNVVSSWIRQVPAPYADTILHLCSLLSDHRDTVLADIGACVLDNANRVLGTPVFTPRAHVMLYRFDKLVAEYNESCRAQGLGENSLLLF